eukprot:m.176400 g.176400  ORF g.176400 m.176400 type:complete len:473 (-) comp17365_c1_seq1:238-1656(-)
MSNYATSDSVHADRVQEGDNLLLQALVGVGGGGAGRHLAGRAGNGLQLLLEGVLGLLQLLLEGPGLAEGLELGAGRAHGVACADGARDNSGSAVAAAGLCGSAAALHQPHRLVDGLQVRLAQGDGLLAGGAQEGVALGLHAVEREDGALQLVLHAEQFLALRCYFALAPHPLVLLLLLLLVLRLLQRGGQGGHVRADALHLAESAGGRLGVADLRPCTQGAQDCLAGLGSALLLLLLLLGALALQMLTEAALDRHGRAHNRAVVQGAQALGPVPLLLLPLALLPLLALLLQQELLLLAADSRSLQRHVMHHLLGAAAAAAVVLVVVVEERMHAAVMMMMATALLLLLLLFLLEEPLLAEGCLLLLTQQLLLVELLLALLFFLLLLLQEPPPPLLLLLLIALLLGHEWREAHRRRSLGRVGIVVRRGPPSNAARRCCRGCRAKHAAKGSVEPHGHLIGWWVGSVLLIVWCWCC